MIQRVKLENYLSNYFVYTETKDENECIKEDLSGQEIFQKDESKTDLVPVGEKKTQSENPTEREIAVTTVIVTEDGAKDPGSAASQGSSGAKEKLEKQEEKKDKQTDLSLQNSAAFNNINENNDHNPASDRTNTSQIINETPKNKNKTTAESQNDNIIPSGNV